MPSARPYLRPTRRTLLIGAGAGAAAVAAPGLTGVAAARGSDVDTVLEWYDVTAATIGVITGPLQVNSSRTWAIAWIAAWRAVTRARGGAPADAALAGAVHEALATLVPARTAELDAALAATLDRLGPAAAVGAAVESGRAAARDVLTERAGDGLDLASVNRPFTPPAPAPGVWQPTPPGFAAAVQAGQGDGRPFLIDDVRAYLPGPPPALDSARYARDLAESRAVGAVESSRRTDRQTDVARFWAQTSLNGYTGALRAAVTSGARVRRVALVALFHAATVDAQIVTYAAKYRDLRWRPVTAIRTETIAPDPAWTPLITTPAHPEYPSGHTTYAGAAETALRTLAGPPAGPVALTSPTAAGVTLTYRDWRELTRDNIDARVWSGIHFRHTDEVGAAVGRRVAAAGLAHWDGRPL
ncbi:phosphatase PAP2 family protein [Micromonospora terminaliae]|uniref:Phosphatase PAP2 family protein n=1 Tax=Micromonospora terminaliae TaxID=1914461 RepID=A0AAJ3DI77_9ACTN|nr:vanadium-dependent haloperoxidase [Micromonospora terminaliae]NES27454.1 vanadium-dependent haloperoxidase [Micromonospora terminaliae]QGL47805.1 phosphatase PAP2 family protein [Micromonospora terminaliae]